jgi:hypothetical protein
MYQKDLDVTVKRGAECNMDYQKYDVSTLKSMRSRLDQPCGRCSKSR